MTTQVNIHEAKTHLSRLLEAVERGEEVIIARAGKPIATLSAYRSPRSKHQPPQNVFDSEWMFPEDVDEPLERGLSAPGSSMAETASAYRPEIEATDRMIAELIRRAESGEDIFMSSRGKSVRLVPVRRPPDAATKKRILEEFRAAASRKITPGPSAARSQDFLYDDDGLPG